VRDPQPAEVPSKRKAYPNPGHLGTSSHVTIFNQIHLDGNVFPDPGVSHTPPVQGSLVQPMRPDSRSHQAAENIKRLFNNFDLASMRDLVKFWLAKGVNLALAEPFVEQCVDMMDHVLIMTHEGHWDLALASRLLQNSDCPLEYDRNSTLSDFAGQFCNTDVRWETLGIFLLAVVRATFDIPFSPSLYTTEDGKHQLRKAAVRLSAYCLETCLSLDCLNDLQLILQYEDFIVGTYIDGDQSKQMDSLHTHQH
jgi:hypothetical protein